MPEHRQIHMLALCILAICSAVQAQNVELDGQNRQFTAGRLQFEIGDNGLPAQVTITAARAELPLEFRAEKAEAPAEEVLRAIGRGPQLRAPMELVATVKEGDLVLQPAAPARLEKKDGAVIATAELGGGGVKTKIQARYASDGSLRLQLAYSGGVVDELALVMRLSGPVDTVVQGVAPFTADDYGLPDEQGVVWGNAEADGKKPTAANRGRPGVPTYLFWGNGDRGFSLLSRKAHGWTHSPKAPAVTLSRDDEGLVTWRALIVNHAAELAAEKQAVLSLLTHPARTPAAGRRKRAWIDWPHEAQQAATPPVATAPLPAEHRVLRADRATAFESEATASVLVGPAGGNASSAKATLADTFPLPLFRYLAGTHTGLPVRLLANTPAISRPGGNPGPDRIAVGRALLHDIGFDYRGAVHRAELAQTVSALAEFGYFAGDGMTEFLPYWRSEHVIRYGETFSRQDAFAVTATDPTARVHVSAWIRPKGKRRQAMILIVNEGDKPMREQLYVLNSEKLFGGANGLIRPEIVDRWEMSNIPENSDWAKARLRGEAIVPLDPALKARRSAQVPFLMDMESEGGVAQTVNLEGKEVYQRVYVPARGFRLLYGTSKEE